MFITPPDLPEDQVCRSIKIPNSLYWLGIFNKALIATIYPYNYKQVEDTHLTAEESAAIGYAIISEYLDGATCDPDDRPFWDDSDAADAPNDPDLDDGFPWYEDVSDWIVTGFLALSFGPEAAIEFVTLARRFRLMFRTRDYGGIVRVLVDGVVQGEVNTYSATPGIAYLDVFTPGMLDDEDPTVPTWTLRIENTGEADPLATPTEDGYAVQVIRKRLWSDEVSPENLRWNEDCDCVEETFDGGDTWVEKPLQDPRRAPQFRFPPIDAGDPQCQAAANMAFFLEEFIEEVLNVLAAGSTVMGLVTLMVALFLVLGPWAIVVGVLLPVAAVIFDAGVTAVSAAFTPEAFNILECILYCRISADGQVDADQLAAINADIDTQIGGLAALVLHGIFQAMGPVGLSNAGTIGEAPADCDECGCTHCFRLDLRVTDGTEYGINVMGGTYEPGVGYYGIYGGPSSESDTYGNWSFGAAILVDFVSMGYTKTAGSGGNDVNRLYGLDPVTGYNTVEIVSDFGNPIGTDTAKVMTAHETLSGVGWDINSGTAASLIALHGFEIYYRGEIPEGWSDNCDE